MDTMQKKPLLLLDNSNMISLINCGEYRSTNISFEEAKAILDMHAEDDVIKCFSDASIEGVIFTHLGIESKNYPYKYIRMMRPNQSAIVFKLYVTPSETQPIIQTPEGVEAKKIQNIYIYCQLLTRLK